MIIRPHVHMLNHRDEFLMKRPLSICTDISHLPAGGVFLVLLHLDDRAPGVIHLQEYCLALPISDIIWRRVIASSTLKSLPCIMCPNLVL